MRAAGTRRFASEGSSFASANKSIGIRRAAVECKEREIRRPKLYESLDFLEKQLDEKSTWLVRRYRRELRWDRRNQSERRKSFGRSCA